MNHVVLCTAGSGGVTLTLPANSSWHNSYTSIMKVDSAAGACTIAPGSGDAINLPTSGSNYVLSSQWQYVTLLSNGSGTWEVIGAGPASGGSSPAIQTNGSNNSSQSLLDFVTSTTNSVGLTATPSNPSGGQEKIEIAGGSYSGNAATASALAATPSQCSGSQFATGIQANGNANCSTPSGGGGGGTTLSTHGSGYVMPWGSDGYWTPGSTLAANDVYAFQFVCCSAGMGIDISTVAYYTSSTATGAYSAIGIYSDNSGSCGTLIAQTTPLETATAGAYYQAPGATMNLTQGTVYWLAITTDTTGWGIAESGASYLPFGMLNQPSYPREVHSTSSGSGSSLAFPSSCAGTANSNHSVPDIGLLP